jgi:hypothetical protein
MPCNFFPIDGEWAALLLGLNMEVPVNWWPAFSGQALNTGRIADVDFDIKTENHFQLELDNEQGVYYAMRYDAVVRFADKTHRSFSLIHLSSHAIRNPVDDVVKVEMVDDDDDNDNAFVTPPTRNKRCRLKNRQQTTINPDLCELVGEDGIADEPGRAEEPGRADKPGRVRAPHCKFTMTKKEDWQKISAAKPGQLIALIPYTRANKLFGVNMTEAEMEGMTDNNGTYTTIIFLSGCSQRLVAVNRFGISWQQGCDCT